MNWKIGKEWLPAVVILVLGALGLVGYFLWNILHKVDTATGAIQGGAIGEGLGKNIGKTVTGLFGSLVDGIKSGLSGIKSWWTGKPAATVASTEKAAVTGDALTLSEFNPYVGG